MREFTSKPVLLSETAVGPRAGQPAKITNLFAGMRGTGRLGWCGSTYTQHDGIYHQDWRIEDSPAADAAFRLGVARELTPALPSISRASIRGGQLANAAVTCGGSQTSGVRGAKFA